MARVSAVLRLLPLVVLLVCVLRAQTPSGAIVGVLTDATGAAIPSAKVVIASKETGFSRTTATNATGEYSAPALPAGTYQVQVDAPGFQRLVREATVQAGATTTLNLNLSVGAASENISVSAASSQLRYDSNEISGAIQRQQIAALPLNGRNFLELARLEPGAQSPVRASNNRMLVPLLGAPTGLNGRGTRVTVDGGSIMEIGNGGSAMGFSQEVVQEFQVATVNADLSTGVTGSGSINIVTRSGGNDLHGTAFFFFRDHHLAAYPGLTRDPFNPDPFFQRRQFGGAAGGPLRKDRAFFFVSYERNEQRGVIGQQLGGDFAPLSRITPSPTYATQFSGRVDVRLNDRHVLFVRQSHERVFTYATTGMTLAGPRSLPSAWTHQPSWVDQSIVGVTSQLRTQLVNDFRFSYFFVSSAEQSPTNTDCPGCLGIGAPAIRVDPLFIGSSLSSSVLARRFHLNDVAAWQYGAHRLSFGGDWEVTRGGRTDLNNEPVTMTLYSPTAVRAFNALMPPSRRIPLPATFLTLNDILQLPLQGFTVGIGDPHVPQANFGNTRIAPLIHLFIHDVWRLGSRLSANYGLGWSYDDPLNPDLHKPAYLEPLLGADGLAPTRRYWTNFSPAAGFAWSPRTNGATVIRGGAGIYYDFRTAFAISDPERISLGPRGVGRSNYDGSTIPNPLSDINGVALGAPLNFRTTPSPFTGADLLQALPAIRALLQQQRGDPNNRDFSVTNIQVDKQGNLVASDLPPMSSWQTSIGLQHQWVHDFVMNADFVVRHYRHLGGGSTGALAIDFNRFTAAPGVGPVLPKCSAAQRNDPQALCSLGPISVIETAGSARYRGLLVRAEKRMSHHWQFLGSYAWSSDVGNSFSNGFDLNHWTSNYGPLDRDVRHILNLSGVIELPGKFQVGWTAIYNSKPPFSAYLGGIDLNGDGTTGDLLPGTTVGEFNRGMGAADLRRLYAQFVSSYGGRTDAVGHLITPLPLAADFKLGDAFLTEDLRLSRTFTFRERWQATLIGEAFNLFNVANLSGRSSDLLAPRFGEASNRMDQVFGSGGPRSFQLAARLSF